MPDPADGGAPQDGERRKRPRGGIPALFTFLLIVMGIILVVDFFGSGFGQQDEIGYNQFLRILYSGGVLETQLQGEVRLTGKYFKDEEERRFTCNVPPSEFEKISRDLREFSGKAPIQKSQGDLISDLEDGSVDPVRAWIVPQLEQQQEWVFVSYYDHSGRLTPAHVQPSSGDSGVSVSRLREALKPYEIKIERMPLAASDTAFSYEPENTFLISLFWNLIPWLLIIGIFWFFIFRQMRSPGGAGGVLSFGRARPSLVSKDRTGVTFADVAGIEEAKEEVREIVEFLKDPARFSRVGARIPRGVMLVGSPGTGKTLLAKAIAGEANVPFFSISGSDFVEMFVGVGASRVRDLFRQAREKTPCLIFLDEIDAVGRRRGSGLGGGHDEREQTLNAILVEMDGFETDEGIILLAATNRPDVLDPALLRPGRFDRQIVIDLPDVEGRKAILEVHGRDVRLHPSVDFSLVARGTPGFSGAELASLVNEAALRATLTERESVLMEDLEEARDRVRFGREKGRRQMDEKERKVTAYHEAGHTVVGALCDGVEPLHKVTIIPRGMAMGSTMILPKRDVYQQGKVQLLGMISFAYGGRVAEEEFFGDITTGAYDDIQRATEIARSMVTQYGMSDKMGAISYAEKDDAVFLGNELVKKRHYSDDTAKLIDAEVKGILKTCYERAQTLVREHRDMVEAIGEALLRFETIHGEEVQAILAGATPDEARKRMEAAKAAAELPLKPARTEVEPRVHPFPEPEEGLGSAGEPAVS
jgi:cell division protease FtsH